MPQLMSKRRTEFRGKSAVDHREEDPAVLRKNVYCTSGRKTRRWKTIQPRDQDAWATHSPAWCTASLIRPWVIF